MREIFDLLSRVQRRRNIDLMIIGGWALQAHHYARQTQDVDCLLALENDGPAAEELLRAGFECFEEKPSFRRFRHRLDPLMILDIMRVDSATFAKMWAASFPFKLSGIELRVPALSHLIALKLHAARNEHRTDRDMGDVRELLKANPGAVSPVDLQQLCNQFGTPEIARRLAAFL